MLTLFSFSPRLTAVTFAVGSLWFAWRISGSKWLAIVVGGSVAVGVSTCLQWTVLVRTRQRWREASEVVAMVLATLKDDGACSTPRHQPGAALGSAASAWAAASAGTRAVHGEKSWLYRPPRACALA